MANKQTSQKSSKSRGRRGRDVIEDTAVVREPVRRKSAQHKADEAAERRKTKPLICWNDAQKDYLTNIVTRQITIGDGPAGTGKTYVCVKFAAQQLDEGNIQRIVVVRPIIEAGGGLGFLPGDEGEKTAPYQVPFLEVLEEHYGTAGLEAKLNCRYPVITFVPPEFIRGRTFKDAFVILDEAQNMTCDQMKTFLTRLGTDAKCVINGDADQVDIKGKSGLTDAIEVLDGLQSVGITKFVEEDIVRSGICKEILLRYRRRKMLEAANEAAAQAA
jgi:phosphate starvation-inducible PhoH-like protein